MQLYEFRRGAEPLYEQLYRALRQDILSGVIPGGQKLPSRRAYAERLGLSENTVDAAYTQLLAEGYIRAKERSGYYVEALPDASGAPAPAPVPGPETRAQLAPPPHSAELFPFSVWARLMRSVLLDGGERLLSPIPGQGLYALREAICTCVLRERGIAARPEQVLVGAGAEACYLTLLQLFGRERVYALENPGHRKIARVYAAFGAEIAPIGMDEEGVLPEALAKSGASVLHLSPSHHYPTGVVTPIARRQALMRWLGEDERRYLIEDDYDSEFRFSGLPIPSMQSMDRTGRVVYMNTFSKTITPALRISYMILPPGLLPLWQVRLGFSSCAVASFEQLTLTRFLTGGYYERHLNRMKKHYRQLRGALLSFLAAEPMKSVCTPVQCGAGLHFVLRFDENLPDGALLRAIEASGLQLELLRDFYIGAPGPDAGRCAVLGYADTDFPALRAGLLRLAQALRREF